MYTHFNPSLAFRKRFCTIVLTLLAETSLAFGQTLHTVTIDFTQPTVSYTDTMTKSGSPTATNPKAYRLKVAVGDTIVWKAKTPGSKHAVAIFLPNGTPLADPDDRPIFMMVWSERLGNSAELTVIETSGTYEYHVVAYDEDKKKPYADDPKIIVGGGRRDLDDLRNGDWSRKEKKTIENP